ncbi:reverse transcriptase domain-containing protein [Tanacetum coccineum]|uniref:Reverse transcriptase domain-containing protein n=1 Tax=Tanacetum coccineum TaxID=301880 RepID=A0ABQ5A8H8_9ASTR
MRTCAPYARREGFTPLTKTPKEILAMDNVNFLPPPPMVGTSEKRNMNKFYDYHQDRGHNTNDCYHLKKQIEEAVASGRLAHLVKDIRQGGQKSKGSAKGKEKVINMVRSQGYRKRPYERVEHWMDNAIEFSLVPRYQLMDCPLVVDALIEGFRDLAAHLNDNPESQGNDQIICLYKSFRVEATAVKGQVLADFLSDTSTEINAKPEVVSTLRMEDIPEVRSWPHPDGSRRCGILSPASFEFLSNNEAEYKALLAGLRIATKMQVKVIHAFVDSKLVASQVEGSYEAKGVIMIKHQEKVLELANAFNRFRITHIPRAENKKADALSKLAAVQFDHFSKEVLVELLNECYVKAHEVNIVVEEEGLT